MKTQWFNFHWNSIENRFVFFECINEIDTQIIDERKTEMKYTDTLRYDDFSTYIEPVSKRKLILFIILFILFFERKFPIQFRVEIKRNVQDRPNKEWKLEKEKRNKWKGRARQIDEHHHICEWGILSVYV